MGDDSRNSHIQSHRNIDKWLALFNDRINKFLHQQAMRTAVTACGNIGRQGRSGEVWQLCHLALVLGIIRSFGSSESPCLGRASTDSPASHLSRYSASFNPE